MRIEIVTIPHDLQEYATCGNWRWVEPDHLRVWVSEMADWRSVFLVAAHEMVEAALCKNRNISDVDVTAFDIAYEETRVPGDDSEPGDQPQAPYFHQHQGATFIEKATALELEKPWSEYEADIAALFKAT
jgi:hypothetical protein